MANLTLQQPHWLQNDESSHDVVLSTRYRLARNLRGFPFPHRLNWPGRQKIKQMVYRAVQHEFPLWRVLDGEALSPLMRQVFFEKHLISASLKDTPEGSMVIFSPEARFSLLVNEEDHLRFQCILPGFQLADSWREMVEIEKRLERWLGFAYHHQYGYLTSCLTNVGTGLRASVMLHLPALGWSGTLPGTIGHWPDKGMEFRGMFGEGSSFSEGFLQLSNKQTLGSDIPTLNGQVLRSADELVRLERLARNNLLEHHTVKLVDSVHRSLALLSSARVMSSEEATAHLSAVRLGACLQILPQFSTRDLVRLLVGMRAGHLQLRASRTLEPEERDQWRAGYLRGQIQSLLDKDSHG